MRTINHIVLHCTATPQNTTIDSIKNYWRSVLGWKSPGYHYMIKANGEVVNTHPIHLISNGVAGHNANSIHISYIGGVDSSNRPFDNRTPAQREAMFRLVWELKVKFPSARILGHRDFPNVAKACPSFDVSVWKKEVGL